MIYRFLQRIKDWWRGVPLGGLRSKEWPRVRAEWLKEHPVCFACGGTKKCEVHHIKMFSKNPELELDKNNLITLCENGKYGVVCHLHYGHLGNYKKENPLVVKDCEIWFEKLTKIYE